jgi:hypothetical protein
MTFETIPQGAYSSGSRNFHDFPPLRVNLFKDSVHVGAGDAEVFADPSNDHLLKQIGTTGPDYCYPLGNFVAPQWRLDGLRPMSRALRSVPQVTNVEDRHPRTSVERVQLAFEGWRSINHDRRPPPELAHEAVASCSSTTLPPCGPCTMRSISAASLRSASAFSSL